MTAASPATADELVTGFRLGSAMVDISPELKITIEDGRVFRFDWHHYCGPNFVGKRGDPLKNQPGARHPVWRPFGWWIRQGKRIDADRNCIWEKPPKIKVRHRGGRHYEVVDCPPGADPEDDYEVVE